MTARGRMMVAVLKALGVQVAAGLGHAVPDFGRPKKSCEPNRKSGAAAVKRAAKKRKNKKR